MSITDLMHLEPVPELPPASERAKLRKRFSLTQDQLAEAIGVTVRTLSRWETGTVEPKGSKGAEYAKLLLAWKHETEKEAKSQ